jgi:cobalt-zinc-cadmium efflux system outer membrane protein
MLLYGYKRTAGFDTILGGLVMDLPFRNRNQGNIAAAIADSRALQAQQRALRIQLEAELNTALNDTRIRRQLLDQTLLPAQRDTEEVLGLARRAYLEGGIDLLRLIDAERVYFETRMQVVRTQTELRQAEASLAFAVGEEP